MATQYGLPLFAESRNPLSGIPSPALVEMVSLALTPSLTIRQKRQELCLRHTVDA